MSWRRGWYPFTLGLAAGLTFGLAAFPAPAFACGGLFCSSVPVDQAGEKILFIQDGGQVIAHVQIQYVGAAQDFSWVVPVPTAPTLGVGSDTLFQLLRTATRPQFNLKFRTDGLCLPNLFPAATPGGVAMGSSSGGVSVYSQGQIGPFDTAVIQADDPGALTKWLTDNKYVIPAKLDPLLAPYVAGKYYFVALRLTKDAAVGDIQPIVLKYKATKPGIPLRLTSVAATPNMAVYVWVLGDHRAIPENFRHASINEARIDWQNQGRNYAQVVTQAMNEAGGQAFVTDYAGDASPVDLSGFNTDTRTLSTLRGTVQLSAYITLLTRFFPAPRPFSGAGFGTDSPKLIAFMKRHFVKPASLNNVPDETFYANLGTYQADLDTAQVAFDPITTTQDLEDTVIATYLDIQTQFKKHPYLTQLFTTMSPEQMTQDPTFLFNPDLPKVSNIHTATMVKKCNLITGETNAPNYIELSDGTGFFAARNGSGSPVLAMPAAARIEQLQPTGGPSLITDNHVLISQTLGSIAGEGIFFDPSTGNALAVVHTGAFGCTGCGATNAAPPPLRQGAGEGLTYLGLVLGWFGYRRMRGRRR